MTPPGGESDLKNGQVDVAPDNTATSGVVAVVGDDEKEPVVKTITPRTPEDKRINTDQIQVTFSLSCACLLASQCILG